MNQTKPTVQIKDCYFEQTIDGKKILSGIVLDYPDDHQGYPGCLTNGRRVWTSLVVSEDGNTVETQRTIYKVLNWVDDTEYVR